MFPCASSCSLRSSGDFSTLVESPKGTRRDQFLNVSRATYSPASKSHHFLTGNRSPRAEMDILGDLRFIKKKATYDLHNFLRGIPSDASKLAVRTKGIIESFASRNEQQV